MLLNVRDAVEFDIVVVEINNNFVSSLGVAGDDATFYLKNMTILTHRPQ